MVAKISFNKCCMNPIWWSLIFFNLGSAQPPPSCHSIFVSPPWGNHHPTFPSTTWWLFQLFFTTSVFCYSTCQAPGRLASIPNFFPADVSGFVRKMTPFFVDLFRYSVAKVTFFYVFFLGSHGIDHHHGTFPTVLSITFLGLKNDGTSCTWNL